MDFNIDNLRKHFPDAVYGKGEKKWGTTSARVLRGDRWHVIESPRYEKGIKCWVHIEGTKQMEFDTVDDFISYLKCPAM